MFDRMSEKQRILDVLWRAGVLPEWHSRNAADIPELTGDLHYAIVRFLAKTPASLMLVSEEDLMKQKDQQNLPGTTAEYPNWRHKTRFTLEELRTAPLARDFARMYRDCLLDSGRA
jgi:4-alpha-glucanotransferase